MLECNPRGDVQGIIEIELPYTGYPQARAGFDCTVVVMRGTRQLPFDETAPCRGVLWEPVPGEGIVAFEDNFVRVQVTRFSLYAVRIFEIAVGVMVARRFALIKPVAPVARSHSPDDAVVAHKKNISRPNLDEQPLVDTLASHGWYKNPRP